MYSIDTLSLHKSMLDDIPKSNKPPKHKQGEKFLKGPIPWKWITEAARLTGRALHVAIAVWFLAGLTIKRTIKLSPTVLRELGVKRRTGYRALEALEKAGLVSVKRHVGRSPIVTLLDARDKCDNE
jgi:hypothetical protein